MNDIIRLLKNVLILKNKKFKPILAIKILHKLTLQQETKTNFRNIAMKQTEPTLIYL